jgi:xanthine dehydrogenase accessory factor
MHSVEDPACAIAHGEAPPDTDAGTLVAVFVSPVASLLLHFGRHLGFRTVLVEPDLDLVRDAGRLGDHVASTVDPSFAGETTDIVITDHDRRELGPVLGAALQTPARWVGVIGSIRHTAPHIAALRELGVDEEAIARVHRPVGLNIGSRTPAEIAVATLAGLIAERNHRPGGFAF